MEEEASDRQLRAKFGIYWSPSEALNVPMREELAKHRTIITNAIGADALVRQRFATNRNAIAMLSLSDVSHFCSLSLILKQSKSLNIFTHNLKSVDLTYF